MFLAVCRASLLDIVSGRLICGCGIITLCYRDSWKDPSPIPIFEKSGDKGIWLTVRLHEFAKVWYMAEQKKCWTIMPLAEEPEWS